MCASATHTPIKARFPILLGLGEPGMGDAELAVLARVLESLDADSGQLEQGAHVVELRVGDSDVEARWA